MNLALQELIDHLELLPHPEGGYYKETFRSQIRIHNLLILVLSQMLLHWLQQLVTAIIPYLI